MDMRQLQGRCSGIAGHRGQGCDFLILKRFHGLQLVLGPYIALKQGARCLLDFWERALHRLKEEKSEQSLPKAQPSPEALSERCAAGTSFGPSPCLGLQLQSFTTVLISLHKVLFRS